MNKLTQYKQILQNFFVYRIFCNSFFDDWFKLISLFIRIWNQSDFLQVF